MFPSVVPDTFTVSGPDGPLSVWMGSSVFLPCSVSPAFTDSLELHWHRPEKFKTPVLLYEKQQIQEQSTDPQYRGRVSLTGELEKGNVSLKLENVTLADSGEYICFVAGKKWYEQASVHLNVKATGTHPVLSVADGGSGQLNVSCVSDGWSPKPTLTWRQQGGTEISQSLDTTVDDGVVRVTSWLLHTPSKSEWLSCSVGLSEAERKESRILPYISDIDTANEVGSQENGAGLQASRTGLQANGVGLQENGAGLKDIRTALQANGVVPQENGVGPQANMTALQENGVSLQANRTDLQANGVGLHSNESDLQEIRADLQEAFQIICCTPKERPLSNTLKMGASDDAEQLVRAMALVAISRPAEALRQLQELRDYCIATYLAGQVTGSQGRVENLRVETFQLPEPRSTALRDLARIFRVLVQERLCDASLRDQAYRVALL
ncbi:hypothetical protein ACEWY4_007247 [Coilia grayii]|uniref:Ig-like domain-containing protein n=1 Tax=Coilia grayii TaxID=363190 RepID=A0ABD1KFW7_9TELE